MLIGKSLKVTSVRKLLFVINLPLRCNELIFLFVEKVRFCSVDIADVMIYITAYEKLHLIVSFELYSVLNSNFVKS